jgi:hypothetical protein
MTKENPPQRLLSGLNGEETEKAHGGHQADNK